MYMGEVLYKVENIIDKLIPIALIALLFVLVIEFFFHNVALQYAFQIEIADALIIILFILDLVFKYKRVRNIHLFLKKYWIEIIAVLPFFLVFRALEGFARLFGLISETAKESQQVLHAGVELSKGFSRTGIEVEEIAGLSRGERFARFLRPLARSPRLLKFRRTFEIKGKELKNFFDKPKRKDMKNKLEFKQVKFDKRMFNVKGL